MDRIVFVLMGVLLLFGAACVVYILILMARLRDERKRSLMKSAFIRNLSNEIRTPLQSMDKQAEMISREDVFLSKDEKKTISGQMMYNVSLISTLLDEMMAYVGNGKGHDIKEECFSPTMICQRCVTSNLNNTYLKPGVRLRFVHEMDDDVFVHSDMHIVELILNKLVINACKFTGQGEILIGCNMTETPDCLTIYVQDSGVGVPEERRGIMFKWFDNPDETGAEVEFDLSVARRMASKLGGTLRFDSTYRNGTRMVLTLPGR